MTFPQDFQGIFKDFPGFTREFPYFFEIFPDFPKFFEIFPPFAHPNRRKTSRLRSRGLAAKAMDDAERGSESEEDSSSDSSTVFPTRALDRLDMGWGWMTFSGTNETNYI